MEKMDRLLRQLDIIPMEVLKTPITVIGAGAVGSHTVKALAQMGFEDITVFDDDKVSEENLNSQGYPVSALGITKVTALGDIVAEYAEEAIDEKIERYTEESPVFPGIIISAVDNMATRRLIWEKHKKSKDTLAVIDPRMGAEIALLTVMKPNNQKDEKTYEKTLFSDDEAVVESCTAKATIYTAMLLAGLVCKAVKDIAMGLPYARQVIWNINRNDCEIYRSE